MAGDEDRRVGAYAVVRQQEPQVYLAEDAGVLDRVLALHLVARLDRNSISSDARLREMQSALLEERWDDALVAWIEETGIAVDVYAEPLPVWTKGDLDQEGAVLEIKISRLFEEERPGDAGRA